MKKQNGTVNLIKFLAAFSIMTMHGAMEFGEPLFQGGWIFVEWFYIFAGYTIAKTVEEKKASASAGQLTAGILKKRIGSIYPYYAVSVVLGLVISLAAGQYVFSSIHDAASILSEFFMLQMTGLPTWAVTGTSWFLSSMWIVLPLFIPFVYKLEKPMRKVLCILIPLLIYGYFNMRDGYLWHPGAWMGFWYKGTPRAFAALLLGCLSYDIGGMPKSCKLSPAVLSLILYVVYALIFAFTIRFDDSKLYFFIPFVFVLLITVGMGKKPGLDIPDCAVTRVCGKLSMLLFMNHYYVVFAIQRLHPEWSLRHKAVVTVAGAFACCAIVYGVTEFFKKIRNKISGR